MVNSLNLLGRLCLGLAQSYFADTSSSSVSPFPKHSVLQGFRVESGISLSSSGKPQSISSFLKGVQDSDNGCFIRFLSCHLLLSRTSFSWRAADGKYCHLSLFSMDVILRKGGGDRGSSPRSTRSTHMPIWYQLLGFCTSGCPPAV